MTPLRHPSLRLRLVMMVAVCTLPAIAVMVYTAFGRYHTALNAAYSVANVAVNAVAARYRDLESGSRNTLSLMAALPAVSAPPAECSQALAELRAQMPVYANLVVVSLDGSFRCSAVPFAAPLNASTHRWFQQVMATRRYASGVLAEGLITHRSLLVFSVPHFDAQGELVGTLNVDISPQELAPPANETTLARYGEVTAFAGDGTLLMRYPQQPDLTGGNQLHSQLFKALQAASGTERRLLPGIDGRPRFYVLRRINTQVADAPLFVASGIDQAAIRDIAFVPLAGDLGLVVTLALLIMLWAWWGTTTLVTRRMRPLLATLRRIGDGDTAARTGIASGQDEFAMLGQGIDSMAEHLQAQTAVREHAEQARKLSQQIYHNLIEQADVGISVRRQSGEYLLVNAALGRMLGYTREELLQMRITDVIEPTEERGHLLKPGASIHFDSWMIHQDGHRVPVEVSSVRLPNGDIQSVQHDLSAREEAERKLADERLFVMHALATLPGVFYVVDSEGKLLRWNRGLQEATGYSNEEIRDLHSADFASPEQRELHMQMLSGLLQGGKMEGERELYTKAGTRIPYFFAARAFRWRGKDCAVGMGVDISARVRAQDELHVQQQLLNEVLNSLPGLFTLCSADGRFLMWNRRLEQVSGYPAAEFSSLSPLELIAPEHRAHVARRIAEVFKQGAASTNADFLCRDGRQIPHHFTARRLDWRGQPTLIGVAVDISEQQHAQQLLQNYLQEVQQLSHRLVNAQEEERRHMAAELHDELGQGLLAIMLSLKEIEKDSSAGQYAALEKVRGLTGQLSEQVRKLSLDLRPSMLDDLGLAATVRWYLRERVALAGFKIKLDMDKDLPRLSADIELACFRVLQVTLTNTAKHAKARNVGVHLRIEGQVLRLTVSDDGQGFDVAAARQRALAGKSFGLLGLEERARVAGGHVEIRSRPGQGTTVEATLPANPPAGNSAADEPATTILGRATN